MSDIGTLPFNQIPANLRQPLFFVEFDNTNANTGQNPQRTLLIGQKLSAGLQPANTPVICTGVSDAKTKCGVGSILAMMMWAYRQNDGFGEVWILPLADDGSAVKAAGTVTFTAAATATGTLYFYIAGILVTMAVTSSQTTANLATALSAAVNAITDLPVVATVSGSVVTLTANNGGALGNDIDLQFNYLGVSGGQALPVGLAATIVAMASGAVNPSLTAGLAALVDKSFDFICNPYFDTTSLNALQSFLDNITGRWSFNRQLYGHSLTAYRGTASAATTLGASRNNAHESIVPFNGIPSPTWNVTAAFFGAMAPALRADPGRPMQTLVVNGILPPPEALRYSASTREAFLFSGLTTFTVNDAGAIAVEKAITTYQVNAFNQSDNSYLGIEVLFQLMFLMRDLATYITSKYPRVKLADDNTRLGPNTGVVTPAILLADMIAHYRDLEYQGFAQNGDAFAQNAVVLKDPSNPNRVNFLWAGTLMDQLNVFATLAQFRNQ